MKRTDALNYIKVEVATHGRITTAALRYYVENRVSKTAFDQQVAIGMKMYRAIQATPPAEEEAVYRVAVYDSNTGFQVPGGAPRTFRDQLAYQQYIDMNLANFGGIKSDVTVKNIRTIATELEYTFVVEKLTGEE